MAEIDPVVLELIAKNDRYLAELRRTTRTADQQLGLQEKRVRKLEQEFQRSSGAIAGTLKGLAATLAAGFGAREIGGLVDNFTRLQNALRVAGLEGERLAEVQERLYALGAQYGVSVNTLADLYGNVAQAGKSLGASQAELLTLTEAVSQSLLITGKSAAEASGATLGLVQALAAGTVRAEEYAQINEGGLRPLLEAAAATERFKGDINALRAAVYDGTVSSKEFYRAILDGTGIVESKASGATITLAGAFQTLNDQLGKYLGEAGQASGATGAMAEAIKGLANNLDVIIPALATIATLMGVRMVAGAVAASGALRALSAYLSIATTSLAGTALAARGAGAALLAAFGGPIGIALAALTVGIGYIIVKSNEATRATGAYAKAQDEAARVTDRAAKVAQDLAGAHGKVRAEALAAARAEAENTKQKLAGARASVVLARAELAKARAFQQGQNRASFGAGGVPGTGASIQGTGDKAVAQAKGNLAAAQGTIASLEKSLETITASINAATAPRVADVGTPGKPKKGPRGREGPDPVQIQQRFASELANYAQQTWGAMRSTATSAEERAELELRGVELARQRTLEEIAADADYSDAQKEKLRLAVEVLADAEREAVAFARRAQQEQEAADLAYERFQGEQDALRLQYDLADTQAERRRLALAIVEAEDEYLRSKLEAVIASNVATEAEKERARIALAAVNATAGDRREATARSNEGALARYARSVKDTDARIEEIAVEKIRDINDSIADALADNLGIKDRFLRDLFSIFLEKNVFGPLAEALGNQGGGAGNIFSSIATALGSLFGGGRASGGPVTAGRVYRVNEGASPGRVEAFRPDVSGQIIPLGRMDAIRGAGGGDSTVTVRLALSGDIDAKIDQRSAGVAVQVFRAGSPQVVEAAVNETIRRSNRGSL